VPLREQVPPRVVDSLTISVDKGKGLGARPSSAGPSKSKRFAGGGGQKALQRMPQRGVEKPTRQDDQWLVREVRSLLNKISPENESVIIQRFAALQIIGSEAFPIIASLILEKAVSEPFYSEVYARVLARLSLEFLAQEDLGLDQRRDARDKPSLWFAPASSQFEETCLEQCERMFDYFFGEGRLLDRPQTDQDAAHRLRCRAQAFLRFVGHLFLARMVSISLLEECLQKLLLMEQDSVDLAWPPQAWIECCCELLDTVGQDLSRTSQGRGVLASATRSLCKWKDLLHCGSEGICHASGEQYVFPPRIRFLICDTLEASQRRWKRTRQAFGTQKGVPGKSSCKLLGR